jgi:hypothetical protein
VVLGPGDAAEGYAGFEGLVVDAETLEGGFDDGLLVGLVVDGEGAGEALAIYLQGFYVAAQDADAEAVEGGEAPASRRTGPSTAWMPCCCWGFILSRRGDGMTGSIVSLMERRYDSEFETVMVRMRTATSQEVEHGQL